MSTGEDQVNKKLALPGRWKPWGPQVDQNEDPGWLEHERRLINNRHAMKHGRRWWRKRWKTTMWKHVDSCRVRGKETKGKHRRNWYHLTCTPYMLNIWLPCQRTSNCLTLSIVKQLQQRKEEQYPWCRAETEQYTWCRAETEQHPWCRAETEQYTWCRAVTELYTWYRAEARKTRSKMMKDEFYASYLKKNSTLLKMD